MAQKRPEVVRRLETDVSWQIKTIVLSEFMQGEIALRKFPSSFLPDEPDSFVALWRLVALA